METHLQLSKYYANLCRGGESNPHGLLHTILSRARLPVPPPRHVQLYKVQKYAPHAKSLIASRGAAAQLPISPPRH